MYRQLIGARGPIAQGVLLHLAAGMDPPVGPKREAVVYTKGIMGQCGIWCKALLGVIKLP